MTTTSNVSSIQNNIDSNPSLPRGSSQNYPHTMYTQLFIIIIQNSKFKFKKKIKFQIKFKTCIRVQFGCWIDDTLTPGQRLEHYYSRWGTFNTRIGAYLFISAAFQALTSLRFSNFCSREVLIFSLGFSVLRSSSLFLLACIYGTYRSSF